MKFRVLVVSRISSPAGIGNPCPHCSYSRPSSTKTEGGYLKYFLFLYARNKHSNLTLWRLTIYTYISYRTANLQTLHFKYLLNNTY